MPQVNVPARAALVAALLPVKYTCAPGIMLPIPVAVMTFVVIDATGNEPEERTAL